jgi:uncharacterized protein YbjT (DUF2867 family)
MPKSIKVFVAGATGQQGGALARVLCERGHHVRALTRDPNSPAAQALRRLGIEVARGDFDDPASVTRAARGVDAAFAMGTPYEAGPEAEVRQGKELVDALRAAGVPYIVYSSVANADLDTGIPHFDSKAEVERHLASLGVSHATVAPVFFMENFRSPAFLPALRKGKLSMALPRHWPLGMIAVEDVAAFTALVVERRSEFEGKRIDIGADEVSGAEAAAILADASGRRIAYEEIPLDALRASNADWAKMFEWFSREGYKFDAARLRREYPEVRWRTLRDWAVGQDWSVLSASAAASPGTERKQG